MKVKLFCKQAAQEKFLDVYSQVINEGTKVTG